MSINLYPTLQPILRVGGENYPAFTGNVAGNVTSNSALYAMKRLAQNVRGMRIPNSGYWIAGEQLDVIIKLVDSIFGGNTSTSDPILRYQQMLWGQLIYAYMYAK